MKKETEIKNKIDSLKASIYALREERDKLYHIGWLQKTKNVKDMIELNRIINERDKAKQDYFNNKLKLIQALDELHQITRSTQLHLF